MSHRTKKILVVEDNRAINEMLVSSLQQELNIEIESADTMAAAKTIVDAQPKSFFLAILDLNLPDAHNGEIVDYVMDVGIPSIVLTGDKDTETEEAILNKGVIEFVSKNNPHAIRYIIESSRRLLENFNRKVLVVDDSDVARMLIVALLEKQNLKVLEAINGVQALKLLKVHKDIDLIVTDYNMPKMDGMELIQNIRMEYGRDEIGVIGISATNDNVVAVKLLKSGANDFIARPFSHEEFNCRINQNIDALANYKKLRLASTTDFMTGLYNRKYLFDTGTKLFQNAQRKNIKLSAAMIDIDLFKQVNDNYGHQVGDLALIHVSDILKQELREGDILARMGGEEFCVLCVNLEPEDAEVVFERVRKTIAESPLIYNDLSLSITVSIGYNDILEDSLDCLINLADNALYKAKETGRNKVIMGS